MKTAEKQNTAQTESRRAREPRAVCRFGVVFTLVIFAVLDRRTIKWREIAANMSSDQPRLPLYEEFCALQTRFATLERQYEALRAATRDADGGDDNDDERRPTHVCALLKLIGELHNQRHLSDLRVVDAENGEFDAHRLVFASRSPKWRREFEAAEDDDDEIGDGKDGKTRTTLRLDARHDIAKTTIRWLYTNALDEKWGDATLLELLRTSRVYELDALAERRVILAFVFAFSNSLNV